MTDKTPKNKAGTPVNTPATLARTTDTAHRALPQANALKARFKEGSIPLQTDFADLIDLANIGRQAVGGAEGQTGPANGFTLSSKGRLELKPNVDKGISVDQDGVAIKLQTISGLTMDKDGISVKPKADSGIELKDSAGISIKPGNGISVDKDGVAVKAEGNKGLQVNNNGVGVKTGNGIAVNSNGVNVKLAKGIQTNGGEGQGEDGTTSGSAGGLNVNQNGFSVDPGDGIQINTRGVSLKLAENSGLSADEKNGLKIVPEQMFQKGMVMMFAGTEAGMPKGWALCDGNGGRPDLRDRFVMGSTGFTNVNKTNSKKVTGTDVDKTYMVSSNSKTTDVNVTVNSHKLTISEIPSHNHDIYTAGQEGGGGQCIYERNGSSPSYKTKFSKSVGGNSAHSHGASVKQSTHNHSVNVVPPYYILAFIIKE